MRTLALAKPPLRLRFYLIKLLPMKAKENFDISTKISLGLDLYWKRLVAERAKEDGEFVFSQDGKIVFVKAKSLLP